MISYDFLKEKEKSGIATFCHEIREKLGQNISSIRIFGSKIKGTSDKYSDIDTFVLVKNLNKNTKKLILDAAYDVDLKFDIILSPIIFEEERFYRTTIQATPFIRNVLNEGIER